MTDLVASLREANESLAIQAATAQHETKAAYRDRDALLALLASMYPAHRCDVEEPWSIIALQLPVGEGTQWPVQAANRDLFSFLPAVETNELPEWAGHSSEERLQVLQDNAAANVAGLGEYSPHQTPQAPPPPRYPYPDGDVTVLGPGIFASLDRAVVCWDGQDYRIPEPDAPEKAPAEDVQAPAEAPKRRGRPRKTAQTAPEAPSTLPEA